jgi:hypothetical protein
MGQVNIVRRSGAYFREYQIDPGDVLSRICLKFGHRNWRAVYQHPENAAFRVRFPDPDQIDYVNPVNLFIPLPGAPRGGKSRRGAPVGKFMIINIRHADGSIPASPIELKQIEPGGPHKGTSVTTDPDGAITIVNPKPGDWLLTSSEWMLLPPATANNHIPPEDVRSLPMKDLLPDPTEHFPLKLNDLTEIAIRRVFYIVCPMCGVTMRVVKRPAGGNNNLCPHDNYNLTLIEQNIEAAPKSFTSPATGQNLAVGGVLCRGTQSLDTAHGTVPVYWDESRFVEINGGDFTFWARKSDTAVPKTIKIIGRQTWGAGPPTTQGRIWEFHETDKNKSPAYNAFGIPSNETLPLKKVFRWMTIHHTTDAAQNSYATAFDLQQKNINDPEQYPDVCYEFVIDGNGIVYEGRPLGIKGSHVKRFNGGNIGIVLAGDFESRLANAFHPDTPTAAQLDTLDNLVEILSLRFGVVSVWSHQKRAVQAGLPADHTECPGQNLIGRVEGPMRAQYPGPPL